MNRVIRRVAIYFSVLSFLLAGGFILINAGRFLIKEDEITEADAIVVLMGSVMDRVLQATDLYEDSLAHQIIMVETISPEIITDSLKLGNQQSNAMLSRELFISNGIPDSDIMVLQGGAKSTMDEAIIIRAFLQKRPDIDTIFMVSSAEHTYRAHKTFEAAIQSLGWKVHIISSPSIYTDFRAEKWWKRKGDIREVFQEYLKLLNFFLFQQWKLKTL